MFLFIMLAGTAGNSDFTITITHETLTKIAAGAIATLLLYAIKRAWPRLWEHFQAVRRLRRAETAFAVDSPGIWISPSFQSQETKEISAKLKRSRIPIVTVANLKGGVGKTTTVANLLAHYTKTKKRRVLALDLDFQGSLTRLLLRKEDRDRLFEEQGYGSNSKAASLVAGQDSQWLMHSAERVFNIPGALCIPAYYTLSNMENRVLFEWLISKRNNDIHYNIARVLLEQHIQDSFDLILLDAPPRLTTACIQALCASTHILIPTILDGLSAEATGSFVDQLATNQSLWPNLRLIGAFGNMTENLTIAGDGSARELKEYEQDSLVAARDAIRQALEPGNPVLRTAQTDPTLPEACFIPNKSELGRRASEEEDGGIAYLPSGGTAGVQELSRAYDRLGDEIDRRIAASMAGNVVTKQ